MDDFSISSRLNSPASVSDSARRTPLSWEKDRQHPKPKPRRTNSDSNVPENSEEDGPQHDLDEEA